jgi:hypothetical protein
MWWEKCIFAAKLLLCLLREGDDGIILLTNLNFYFGNNSFDLYQVFNNKTRIPHSFPSIFNI